MKSLGDLNWRLAALVCFLNALGGWGFLPVRRFGIPAAIALWAYFYFRSSQRYYQAVYLITAALVFGVFSMPLTLFGDSIQGNILNWIWILAFGPIQVLALFPLVTLWDSWDEPHDRWLHALWIHAIVVSISVILSNTIRFPVHAWVEIFMGLSYGGLAAWIIGDENDKSRA